MGNITKTIRTVCPRRSVRKINTDSPEMAPLKRLKLCQALIRSWLNWEKEKKKRKKTWRHQEKCSGKYQTE